MLKYIIIFLCIGLASGHYDEVTGTVTKVIDGDTIDVMVTAGDHRLLAGDIARIRLADIDTPEVRGPKACEAGRNASAYTCAWLLSNTVLLDIDNKTGQDSFDRWVAVVYLQDGRNFNMQLVTSGHATLDDFKNNEFDPADWR